MLYLCIEACNYTQPKLESHLTGALFMKQIHLARASKYGVRIISIFLNFHYSANVGMSSYHSWSLVCCPDVTLMIRWGYCMLVLKHVKISL